MPASTYYLNRFSLDNGSFHDSYFNSGDRREFSRFLSRVRRYQTYWGHYENNVYRKVHHWAEGLKSEYQLYSYIRSIYSPAYRLGEFWATRTMGGRLDPQAGNGVDRPSALPILTENEALRPLIANLWRLSNWQTKVTLWTRYGAVMGDVGLRIVDDEARQAVYLEVVHPGDIEDIYLDPFGNVKGYRIVELRDDPRADEEDAYVGSVLYREECEKDGENVIFRTYLDDELYDWRDYPNDDAVRIGPEWEMDYGFVPLVWTKHIDQGRGGGWAEMHAALSKLHELDDMASKLDDQIRKMVDAVWLYSGVERSDVTLAPPAATADNPNPERRWTPAIYSRSPDAKAFPLVAPLDIAAASAHILTILRGLESDYPELVADDPSAIVSGESRRVARQKVEAKVESRRAVYDDGLVRAHKMACSIGAQRLYPGFEGFTRESYARGELDHSIGPRPIFAVDPLDRFHEYQAEATALKTLVDAGVPKTIAAKRIGWSEDQIAEMQAAEAAESQRRAANVQRAQAAFLQGQTEPSGELDETEDEVPGVEQ